MFSAISCLEHRAANATLISFAQYFACLGGEGPESTADGAEFLALQGCLGVDQPIEEVLLMDSPCENPADEEVGFTEDHVSAQSDGANQALTDPIGIALDSAHAAVPECPPNYIGVPPACVTFEANPSQGTAAATAGKRYGGVIEINIVAARGPNPPPNRCNLDATLKGVQLMADCYYFVGRVASCQLNTSFQPACNAAGDGWCNIDDIANAWNTWSSTNGVHNPGAGQFGFVWVNYATANGVQVGGNEGPAVGAEHTDGKDWSRRAIAQHEISHMFGAIDEGTWGWEGKGVMNYYHAWRGRTHYDQSCTLMYRWLHQTTQTCV